MKAFHLIALSVILLASSCHKKAVHKLNKDFIGTWKHIENSEKRWYLDIGSSSWGNIDVYNSSWEKTDSYGENPDKWRLNPKKDILYLGGFTKKFKVDKYPVLNDQLLIIGMDTIESGNWYMILDNMYFEKIN